MEAIFSICKMRRLYTLSNHPHAAHIDDLGVTKAPSLGEPMGRTTCPIGKLLPLGKKGFL